MNNKHPHLSPVATTIAMVLALFGLASVSAPSTVAAPATTVTADSTHIGSALARVAATTYRMVDKRERIPLQVRTVKTSTLPKGTRRIARWGHPGTRVITYRVTYRDGTPVAARKVRTRVERRPLSRIVKVGTRTRAPQSGGGSSCSSHYRGACVPIASDVDCAGGSGNGPRYVAGPVYVVDYDIYDLDSDGDGVGCE